MAYKTPLEMRISRAKKIGRTITRLKHSLAADEEINELMKKIDDTVKQKSLSGKNFKEVSPESFVELL